MHRPPWSMGKGLGTLVVAALLGLWVQVHSTHAAEYTCAAGDVACVITALHAANATGEADTITLAAGTYSLTAVDNDTEGPNGLPSITSTLTITGAGADRTILERTASAPSFRLMHVAAAGALTLEGLTMRGGLSGSGGGLRNAGGTVTITRSLLTDNVIAFEGPGGGLFNDRGTVVIIDSSFVRNSAAAGSGAAGGGVYSDGGTVAVLNSTLTGNHGSSGGGLLIARGIGTITNTTIADNKGSYFGGGLATYHATVTISRSTLAGNEQGLLGGGLYATETSTVTMTQSAVIGNTASLSGGGLYTAGNSLMTITDSTVAGNRTLVLLDGGGGGLYADATSTVTITNSTLAHNAAGAPEDNAVASAQGGGLFSADGTVALENTILAGNQSATGPDCSGPVTSLGANLIGDPTDCTLALHTSDLTGDPKLGAFIDTGAPGGGHFPLLPDSPAINAGNDAVCPETDQLGQPRLGRCDIGAVEFYPLPVDMVAIKHAIFVDPLALLAVVATSSAAPEAELFVTVPVCLTEALMRRISDRYVFLQAVPACGNLNGQMATVTSSRGGSANALLR
jgi:hypothetical protein